MEQAFIDILKQLVKEHGNAALMDAKKCKALLADYTRNEYKKQSRAIVQAVEAEVAKIIDGADDLPACKKAQISELEEEYGLSSEFATNIVNALALVLRGDTTKIEIKKEPFSSPASNLSPASSPSPSPKQTTSSYSPPPRQTTSSPSPTPRQITSSYSSPPRQTSSFPSSSADTYGEPIGVILSIIISVVGAVFSAAYLGGFLEKFIPVKPDFVEIAVAIVVFIISMIICRSEKKR